MRLPHVDGEWASGEIARHLAARQTAEREANDLRDTLLRLVRTWELEIISCRALGADHKADVLETVCSQLASTAGLLAHLMRGDGEG